MAKRSLMRRRRGTGDDDNEVGGNVGKGKESSSSS